MLRHYYIVDSQDELEIIEHELQSYGIDEVQIHTLTNDDKSLGKGKTILFIDIEQQQELTVNKIMISHPNLKPEGITATTPEWLIRQQKKLQSLLK